MLRASTTTLARLEGGRIPSGASKASVRAGVFVGIGVAVEAGVDVPELGVAMLPTAPSDGVVVSGGAWVSSAIGVAQPAITRTSAPTRSVRTMVCGARDGLVLPMPSTLRPRTYGQTAVASQIPLGRLRSVRTAGPG